MKQTSRQPSTLPDAVQRHLNAYAMAASAAGAAMLTLAQPVEARIIYREVNIEIPPYRQQALAFQTSKNAELMFTNNNYSGDSKATSFLSVHGINGTGNSIVEEFRSGHNLGPAALKAGVTVGSRNHFEARGRMAGHCIRCFTGPWANGGEGVKRRYLGARIIISGETHYGWVRMNVRFRIKPYDELIGRVTGYAYETIPNKPIITGKTKGSDVITLEPGSLGRLAQGSAGRLGK